MNKKKEFEGKVAFITGGANGIGQSAVKEYLKRGAKVVIADLDQNLHTQKIIEKSDGEAHFCEIDVSNENSMKKAISETIEKYGRMDFAFNNAGIRNVNKLSDLTLEEWNRILEVNLTGVFLGLKYQLPEISKTHGAIVNTASIWGMTGAVNRSAYVASKAGVIGLTKTAASEYKEYGVRVNAVAPGLIITEAAEKTLSEGIGVNTVVDHTPVGHPGKPTDISEAVVWLCSDKASFINGVTLPVDGGWSSH